MTSPFFNEQDLAFSEIENSLEKIGFRIVSKDLERPWGGFLVIDENQTALFLATFFDDLETDFGKNQKLSPKILIVNPQKRLSWQYHSRRAEIWKLVAGEAGVIQSATDQQNQIQVLEKGKTIILANQERHRLVGLNGVGIVAEIWQHTDPQNPSDEQDIVRLADDFGR